MANPIQLLTDALLDDPSLPWVPNGGHVRHNHVIGLGSRQWAATFTAVDQFGTSYWVVQIVTSDAGGNLTLGWPLGGSAPIYESFGFGMPMPPSGGWSGNWWIDAQGNMTVAQIPSVGTLECIHGKLGNASVLGQGSPTITWGTPYSVDVSAYDMVQSSGTSSPNWDMVNAHSIFLWNSAHFAGNGWNAGDVIAGKVDPTNGFVYAPQLVTNASSSASFGAGIMEVRYADDNKAFGAVPNPNTGGWGAAPNSSTSGNTQFNFDLTTPNSQPIIHANAAGQVDGWINQNLSGIQVGYYFDAFTLHSMVRASSVDNWTQAQTETNTVYKPLVPWGSQDWGTVIGGPPWRTPYQWDPVFARGFFEFLSYTTDISGNVNAVWRNRFDIDATGTIALLTAPPDPANFGQPNVYDPSGIAGAGGGGPFVSEWDYELTTWGNDGYGHFLYVFAHNSGTGPPFLWAGATAAALIGPKWFIGGLSLG